MRMTKLVFVGLVTMLPGFAAAGGSCGHGHETTAMSCASGFVWDEATQTCVEQATS